ncbi:uncharacterized protein LOC114930793 [Nylanderia fulva]|uniref:uncharacterized protein LOC114930793 n=1 Tax=Nylanderia fulva TaxID=613905 RepID=UPI0010FBB82C|nr:uncharacterized protein LOC114930793 [Nylanderia fulva]
MHDDMEVDTSDEDIEHINLDNSSPTLIDVIDLTKESPRNRPSQPGRTRNASANPYVTKSSASYQHRRVVLPIVLGRRQNRTDFPPMKRRMRNNNEIVNLDDTIVLEEKKMKKQVNKNG